MSVRVPLLPEVVVGGMLLPLYQTEERSPPAFVRGGDQDGVETSKL